MLTTPALANVCHAQSWPRGYSTLRHTTWLSVYAQPTIYRRSHQQLLDEEDGYPTPVASTNNTRSTTTHQTALPIRLLRRST